MLRLRRRRRRRRLGGKRGMIRRGLLVVLLLLGREAVGVGVGPRGRREALVLHVAWWYSASSGWLG